MGGVRGGISLNRRSFERREEKLRKRIWCELLKEEGVG
jgi:hypothetical protein